VDTERLRERIRELEQVEAFLGSILESAPGYVVLVDEDAKFLYVNRTAPGLTREQVYGSSVFDWIPPEHHPVVRDCFQRVLKTGQPDYYEITGTGPHGSTAHYQTHVGAVRDEQGKVVHLALLTTDVTQFRNAERALRESQEKLELTLAATQIGLWSWDAVEDTVVWDDRLAEIFGLDPQNTPRDFEGYLATIHPEDRAAAEAQIGRSLEQGRYEVLPHRIVRPDGTIRWVVLTGTVYFDEAGRPVRLAGGVLDMTERRELEERQHRSSKLEAIGRLAGGVAHDFNNLLTVVIGNCEQLSADASLDESQRGALHDVLEACQRATDLTRQLLAFGRRQLLAPRLLDINGVVLRVERLLRRLCREDTTFTLELTQGLPAVSVDPSQLERVITNLVANARDAIGVGGAIRLSSGRAEDDLPAQLSPGCYVTVSVSDTGQGMSAETQARIFEPFFSTKGEGGSGLGLATVLGIIEQSGGTIAVESRLGEGTAFTVYLPAQEETPSQVPKTKRSSPHQSGEIRLGHLLLVEDEKHVRAVVQRQLEFLGYQVVAVDACERALEVWRDDQYQVIGLLTDLVLTGQGGDALAKLLRAERPDLPVVIMTGYAPDVERLRDVGPKVEVLSKPFSLAQLEAVLEESLARRR
jgi:PAS domain S-box-containing protein